MAADVLVREQVKWREKLRKAGFHDQEDVHGNLSHPDLRTNGFETRGETLNFFLSLDCLLTHYKDMPKFERKVLALYSDGVMIAQIHRRLKCSEKTTRMVIKRYKGLVRAIMAMTGILETHAENPHALRPQEIAGFEAKREAREDGIQNPRSAA